MKNTIWILVLFLGLWGCADDDGSGFDSMISRENISFKAIPGGAIMYYDFKGHKDIFSVRARYTTTRGESLTVDGTYLSDSLKLIGFDDARQGVPVYLTFLNNKLEESGEMELAFDTEDSAPAAFFKTVKVLPGWNGFQINYEAPETTGLLHVFYLGINPLTNEPDTIWLQSTRIMEGYNTLSFSVQQERESNTVILTTEDLRGYRVKRQVWENVEAYAIAQFPSDRIKVEDPCGIVVENESYRLGSKYLFDGDTKGVLRRGTDNPKGQYCLFGLGPNALGKYWILDLGEERMIAKLRIFAAYAWEAMETGWYFRISKFYDRFPNELKVYGGNDLDDEEGWDQLCSFYESPLLPGWAAKSSTPIKEVAVLERSEPIYADLNCVANGKEYRYIKIVPHDTFWYADASSTSQNTYEAVILSELEVYVKKE
ncbi:DUF4959 domain-containing protein [Butyricimonas synergistica]|uniref:DUF4959 domain-containing protein n=1 Tax=Butyricimonas synergistica TaxID=544644 RepID=UPI00039A0F8C|nr:DUF4959 domain-containing protein [Butyricimonas synergistica]